MYACVPQVMQWNANRLKIAAGYHSLQVSYAYKDFAIAYKAVDELSVTNWFSESSDADACLNFFVIPA